METLRCMRIEDRPAGETPAGKVDPSPMFGAWFNTDKNTGGVVRMELRESGGRFVVQAWGAGSPELFDWGETAATAHAANVGSREGMAFSAVYDFGFVETFLAAYTKSGILVLDTFNTFKDGSGRADYFTREFFHR
ncbi:MAG TPA: hypothetical protein VGX68_09545 [Thermoanaerobaculia bacterium]|nr:hypothetical protein [Thermoanaerobaculia bacterium]